MQGVLSSLDGPCVDESIEAHQPYFMMKFESQFLAHKYQAKARFH